MKLMGVKNTDCNVKMSVSIPINEECIESCILIKEVPCEKIIASSFHSSFENLTVGFTQNKAIKEKMVPQTSGAPQVLYLK